MAGFITRWTVAGDATARTVTLPLYNSGTFNCTVNWGDGTSDSTVTAYNDADRAHTYAIDGTYDITITGECPAWSFNNAGDKLKITQIVNWGTAGDFGGFSYLTGGFYGCTNLTNIGASNKVLSKTNLTSLNETFRGCTGFTSIPAGVFDNLIYLGENGYYRTFYGCTGITAIPTDLFRYSVSVAAGGFRDTFFACSALATVPTDVFRYNTLASSFHQTFYGCSLLPSVPTNLFKYNTAATSFYGCFDGNLKLTLNRNIFYADGEQGTRFVNKTVDFTNCFSRSSFTGSQGTAPDLWNCFFGSGGPAVAGCFTGAGNSPTSIANYASIPTTWTGPYFDDLESAVRYGAISIADVQHHIAVPPAAWYTEMVARGVPSKNEHLIHQISQVAHEATTHYDLLSGTAGTITEEGVTPYFPPTEVGLAIGASETNNTIIRFGTNFQFMQETSHSYDAWIRVNGGGDQCIWANGDENSTSFQALLYDNATDSLAYKCVIGATLRSVSAAIESDTLYHVAVTRDYDSGAGNTTLAIYLDSVIVDLQVYTGAPVVTDDDFVMLSTSESGGVFTRPFAGATVGNRFYNDALTQAEVDTIYAADSAVILNGPYATQTITPATLPATISGAVEADGVGGYPIVLVQAESGGAWRAIGKAETETSFSEFSKVTPVNALRLYTKSYNTYGSKVSYFDDLDGGEDPGEFSIGLVEIAKNKQKALENIVLQRKPLHSWAVMVVKYV